MSRVLLLYEREEPTNQELFNTLSKTISKKKYVLRKRTCTKVSKKDFEWCDVVYAVRSTSSLEYRLSQYAKKMGKFWITFIDDDFLSLNKDYGADGHGYYPLKKRALVGVLENTDLLVSSNKKIIEKYCKIGDIKRSSMIYTAFSEDDLAVPKQSKGKIKIVLYVNDGSSIMFDKYVKSAIEMIAERFNGKVALYLLSLRPDLSDIENKIEVNYVDHMTYEEFKKFMKEGNFNIGLAPLDDEGFSQYKYFNKFVEYTRAGATGIYSDCELYRQVIVNEYNGLLCKNTTEDWFNNIRRLINNPEETVKMAKNAQNYALEHFGKNSELLQEKMNIPEFETYTAENIKVSAAKLSLFKGEYVLFRVGGWIYLIFTCIRNGNFSGLKRRAYGFFRRIREVKVHHEKN